MAEAQVPKKQPLDDVMLAMDVVDTLRHSQRLVERELDSENREQALIQRLRDIYTSQGIEVPDHILAEGVAALQEERFKYHPPEAGFAAKLANIYVNRSRWGRPLLFGVGILAVALMAYLFVGQYRFEQQKRAVAEIQANWEVFLRSNPEPEIRVVGTTIHDRIQAALKREDVDEAQVQATQLETLQKLQVETAALLAEAQASEAGSRAEQYRADGVMALRRGDAKGAQTAIDKLEALKSRLEQEYVLQIVSRPNEPSGVWRVPVRNPTAKNYYLLVEAIGSDGKALTLPITSEEDGKTVRISQWGVRVSEQTFARIYADKQDDGIIQNNRLGIKRRGFLEPEYLIPTVGGAITSW